MEKYQKHTRTYRIEEMVGQLLDQEKGLYELIEKV